MATKLVFKTKQALNAKAKAAKKQHKHKVSLAAMAASSNTLLGTVKPSAPVGKR